MKTAYREHLVSPTFLLIELGADQGSHLLHLDELAEHTAAEAIARYHDGFVEDGRVSLYAILPDQPPREVNIHYTSDGVRVLGSLFYAPRRARDRRYTERVTDAHGRPLSFGFQIA